ncbi:MAG: amylo-alpha-1,6-glucosidase [Bryobacteraceae bacterium]
MCAWWFALLPVLSALLAAADLEISRPARTWEFLDATGPQASFLGREDGTLEAYVYPLKIVKDLKLSFRLNGRVIPAESVARRIESRPGSYTIVYSGDEYEVRETLIAPLDRPAVLIRLEIDSQYPIRIDVEFTRDFQLMWPASIGTSYSEWNEHEKAFFFGADGQPYAAVLGSPDADLIEREYGANYSSGTRNIFTLGTVQGRVQRLLAIAGSGRSRDDALSVWHQVIAGGSRIAAETDKYYDGYLTRTVTLDLPDKELQRAYDWSRVSMAKGLVQNPLLGTGLVAGYGPSKGGYRPGFAWFFGRDTFWTSFALTSDGDFETARAGIDFIAGYQSANGKIPHEISQSASLVPWFQNYPYGYASADATPLYVIAVANFVQASGDIAFARKHWDRLLKAFEFMRSTLDANGFPKNFGVGHGWVEGGPLLPVQVEFYQAGAYVEALRSMADLARWAGEKENSVKLEQELKTKQILLNDLFWLPQSQTFAFALDRSGKQVQQPSVLATVPMWFGVLDQNKSLQMVEKLSAEQHASDWGMRIISSQSPMYGPEGYHYGSVWPLFTGWASVGEYRSHAAPAAYANLKANAWLALDGAGGNTTEVLSGMTYSPLSTASPHQIWSAAMVVSPLLRGLCGLEVDAVNRQVTFAPHMPADWEWLGVHNLPVGPGKADLRIDRDDQSLHLRVVNHGTAVFALDFAPAYAPGARINKAKANGQNVRWIDGRQATDSHPHFKLQIKPGENTLAIEHRGTFGYVVPYVPPQLGAASSNLKLISEHWSNNGSTLELTVSGRPSTKYSVRLLGSSRVVSVSEATQQGGTLAIEMPPSRKDDYVTKTITLRLRQ